MDSQQAESRSPHRRRGRGLSAAAADDFCDCPEKAYLGTGWVEETEDGGSRDSSSSSNKVSRGKQLNIQINFFKQLWEAA